MRRKIPALAALICLLLGLTACASAGTGAESAPVQTAASAETAAEPVPSQPPETEPATEAPTDAAPAGETVQSVLWQDGGRVMLWSAGGVSLYLTQMETYKGPRATLELVNGTDQAVVLTGGDLICNDTVHCDNGFLGPITAEPGQTGGLEYGLNFGDPEQTGAVKAIRSLEFACSLTAGDGTELWSGVRLRAERAPGDDYALCDHGDYYHPLLEEGISGFGGAEAEPQTLAEEDGLLLELLRFAQVSEGSPGFVLHLVNRSEQTLYPPTG